MIEKYIRTFLKEKGVNYVDADGYLDRVDYLPKHIQEGIRKDLVGMDFVNKGEREITSYLDKVFGTVKQHKNYIDNEIENEKLLKSISQLKAKRF